MSSNTRISQEWEARRARAATRDPLARLAIAIDAAVRRLAQRAAGLFRAAD